MRVSFHGADRDELLAWHHRIAPKRSFLVHGEEQTVRSFAERLDHNHMEMPSLGQIFDL